MAHKAIYHSQLTDDVMNGDQGYRVKLSWGTFTVSPKKLPNGVYYSAYKRRRGHLHKLYLGKQGEITRDLLQHVGWLLAIKAGLI